MTNTGSILEGKQGRYRVGTRIGQGGIGEVYRGVDLASGTKVAIKILSDHRFELSDSVFERFLREISHGAGLMHPNLVQTIDFDASARPAFLVMELVDGKLLSNLVASMTIEQRIIVAEGLLSAVAHLHSLDLIHRDLKTNNVIIQNDGSARVCDYGLLKRAEGDAYLTDTTDRLGSLLYTSSRQQRQPSTADKSDDIYSTAACLFEIFSGTRMSIRWHVTPLRFGSTRLQGVIREVLTESASPMPTLDELRELVVERRVRRPSSRHTSPTTPLSDPQFGMSPNARFLAISDETIGVDRAAVIDLTTDRYLGSITVSEAPQAACRSFAWSQTGAVLLASAQGSVVACALPELRLLFAYESIAVYGNIAVSPSGTRLCWGNVFGTIVLVDAATGEHLHEAQLHPGAASLSTGMWWSPDSQHVLVQAGQKIQLWGARRGAFVTDFQHYCEDYQFSESGLLVQWLNNERFAVLTLGGRLVIGGLGGEYQDQELTTRGAITPGPNDGSPIHQYALATHRDRVAFLARGMLEIWDSTSAAPRASTRVEEHVPTSGPGLVFSPDGSSVAVSCGGGVALISVSDSALGEPAWICRSGEGGRTLGWDARGRFWAIEGHRVIVQDGNARTCLEFPETVHLRGSLVHDDVIIVAGETYLVRASTMEARRLTASGKIEATERIEPEPVELARIANVVTS